MPSPQLPAAPDPQGRAFLRYRSAGGAAGYSRKYKRSWSRAWTARREARLLGSFLRSLPPRGSLLNVPCGTGRFHQELSQDPRPRLVFGDFSPAMLQEAARTLGPASKGEVTVMALDLLRDQPGECFDIVVCIRLLHHLHEPAQVARVLDYLTASARAGLILTFASFETRKGRLRERRRLLGLRPHGESILKLAVLDELLSARGWRIQRACPLARFFSSQMWVLALPREAAQKKIR